MEKSFEEAGTSQAPIRWHPFEVSLSVMLEDVEFAFRAYPAIAWTEYLLNPRRLRGSDFLMRWSQGQRS